MNREGTKTMENLDEFFSCKGYRINHISTTNKMRCIMKKTEHIKPPVKSKYPRHDCRQKNSSQIENIGDNKSHFHIKGISATVAVKKPRNILTQLKP